MKRIVNLPAVRSIATIPPVRGTSHAAERHVPARRPRMSRTSVSLNVSKWDGVISNAPAPSAQAAWISQTKPATLKLGQVVDILV